MAPLYLCLIRALGNYNYPFYVIAVFPCFDLGYVLIAILCFHMYSLKLNFTLFTPNYSNQVKNKLNTICNYNIKTNTGSATCQYFKWAQLAGQHDENDVYSN